MNKREDYEHLEREVDGFYYWWINNDVIYVSKFGHQDPILDHLALWFYKEEEKVCSLYYKGTRLYFTYNGVKYHLSWVFYSRKLITTKIQKLFSRVHHN